MNWEGGEEMAQRHDLTRHDLTRLDCTLIERFGITVTVVEYYGSGVRSS